MTIYRISWRPGNAQDGYWHQLDTDTEAGAAWAVATTVAASQGGPPPELVECAEIDPQSGKPVRPAAP